MISSDECLRRARNSINPQVRKFWLDRFEDARIVEQRAAARPEMRNMGDLIDNGAGVFVPAGNGEHMA